MHHLPDSFSAIRETPSGRMSAYSRPLYSSIGRALLRSIKVAPPGEYRMPVRRPNPPTEEHQYASQRDGSTACDLIFHPLGMACFTANAEVLQVFDFLCRSTPSASGPPLAHSR
jgi:hypothetical protein